MRGRERERESKKLRQIETENRTKREKKGPNNKTTLQKKDVRKVCEIEREKIEMMIDTKSVKYRKINERVTKRLKEEKEK